MRLARRGLRVSEAGASTSLHMGAGVIAAMLPFLFRTRVLPVVLTAGTALAVLLLRSLRRRRGRAQVMRGLPGEIDTALLLAAAGILMVSAWHTPLLISIPLLVTIFARTAAGRLKGGPNVWAFCMTGLAVTLGWEAFGAGPMLPALGAGLAVGGVVAVIRVLTPAPLRDLTLPVAASFTLLLLLRGSILWVVVSQALAAPLLLWARREGALDGSGAGGAFLLAAWLLGGGGWAWALPMVVFFVLSSALSRREAPARRDLAQVAANGGPAFACFLAWVLGAPPPLAWVGYLGALAEASADTWATEIGTRVAGATRLITTGSAVPVGTSGGISLAGSLGGVAGAVVVAGAGALMGDLLGTAGVGAILSIWGTAAIAGLVGAVSDSVAGATIQAHYRCTHCGRVVERPRHCGRRTERVRGLRGVDNDVVNASAGWVGIAVAVSLTLLRGARSLPSL